MSEDLDTEDLREAKARKAEAKRRHSFLEQVRSNWTLIAALVTAGVAVWNSYDGLRKEVARASDRLAELSVTVSSLSVSERNGAERVIILEVGQRDLDRRVQTIEGWLRQTAATPAGRRLDMPAPPVKE